MATASPYRKPISNDTIKDLEARLKTYKNGPHWKAAIRNPAYCVMSWAGGSVPVDTVKWNETYVSGKFQKPAPALESVEIILNPSSKGDLVMEAKFSVKLFTKDDFDSFSKSLCKLRLPLKFDFGYKLPFGDVYSGKVFEGFSVSGYAFNTQPDGTYIIEGSATGPSVNINGLNANFEVRAIKTRKYLNDNKKYDVVGILELLTYWAQGNGAKSIDKMQNGDVLVDIPAANKLDGSSQSMGSIVIYDSKHLEKKGIAAGIGRFISNIGATNNELNKTNNIIYISLETIVALFNTEILPMYLETAGKTETAKRFSKFSIEFDPDLSFSYIDANIRSAYPTKVLLMDPFLSNYKNIDNDGKNFFEDAKNKDAIKSTVQSLSGGRNKIDLRRIFIERSIIAAALDGVPDKQGDASTISDRTNRDASTNIKEFFMKIFEVIKSATGDRISLTLSNHPDVFDSNDEKAHKQYIFDETNGYTAPPLKVWQFNPIDGDGVTRAFTIKSDMGGQNFQVSQFGPSTDADALAQAEGVQALIDAARAVTRAQTILNIKSIITDPGQLAASAFDEVHMQALKGAFVKMKDSEAKKQLYNNLKFIGMGCEVELDGIWGINPGMGIWSTQMPDHYTKNQVYFSVTSTIHKFDGNTSDWATVISGLLIGHEKVNYIPASE